MMLRREITVTPDAPLHLANRQAAGNHSPTLDYIPGSSVRGAVAMTYLNRPDLQRQVAEHLQQVGYSFQDYFDWAFLSGQVRFSNLYPKQTNTPSLVIPTSARSCKRFSGFRTQLPSPYGHVAPHGVFDILMYEPETFRCSARGGWDSECRAPMEELDGYYASDNGALQGARRVEVSRRTLTRTAIENATETVEQRMLFSLEALEEGGGDSPIFSGELWAEVPETLEESAQKELLAFLCSHLTAKLSTLRVGAAKTRGLGTVRLQLSEQAVSHLKPLSERFDALQQKWKQTDPQDAEQTVFTLTLNSDAIVLDKLWRYSSVLDEAILSREVEDTPACCLKRAFTHTRIVSGWNSAHQLPKPDELAIAKGASFLYTTTVPKSTVLKWLQRIETEGIGERRVEGFGQVIACHPFHLEVPHHE